MPPEPKRPAARRCPICGKPTAAAHRPFCSERCRLVDLGRWLKGDYRFATDEAPDPGEEPPSER